MENWFEELIQNRMNVFETEEHINYNTDIENNNAFTSNNVENDLNFLYMENGEDGYEQ